MATLKDIAREVGVSPSTVSHVLNNNLGHVRVSLRRREQIQEVARRLAYSPQRMGRALATRRSYALALVTVRHADEGSVGIMAGHEYFMDMLLGMDEVCDQANYHVLFSCRANERLDQFVYPQTMRDGSVDGVVLAAFTRSETIRRLAALGIPCVQAGNNIESDAPMPPMYYPHLGPAFAETVRRLWTLGHRRIHLHAPEGPAPQRYTADLRQAVAGVEGLDLRIAIGPTRFPTPEQTRAHARALAEAPHRPTAVIAGAYHVGLIVDELAHRGMHCPRDYALVTFGTTALASPHMQRGGPATSLVEMPMVEIGRRSARHLLRGLTVLEPGDPEPAAVPCPIHFDADAAMPAVRPPA